MSKLIENALSHAVSFLEMHFNDETLATGTAFFWRKDGRAYLVTNWHNLSGRDPITHKPLDEKTLAVPNRISFHVWKRIPIEGEEKLHHLQPNALEFSLIDEETSEATWYEHPVHGSKIDVAIVDLGEGGFPDSIEPVFANEQDFDGKVRAAVGQDVFIIGYPLGCIEKVALAVWKRGTIATEPYMHYGDLPKVYVDTASRSGMSGSLVLASFEGFGPYEKTDGSNSDTLLWRARKIFGVYSGRLSPDEYKIQLGIVWKIEVVDEIIAAKRKYAY
jgi:hypothetical protein